MEEKKGAAQTFEELHIYQRATELTNEIYSLTRNAQFAKDYSLVDQIRRASVSIMSNIAEGFERGSKPEFIQFLFIAKGSCGEVRAQLQIAHDQGYLPNPDYDRLRDLAKLTGGMISNFIAHLQKTEYQGEKFSRPKRQYAQQVQERIRQVREAQEVNIRAREEKEKKEKNEP
jgi:four helix bundle protein